MRFERNLCVQSCYCTGRLSHRSRDVPQRAWYRPSHFCRVQELSITSRFQRESAMQRYKKFNLKTRLAGADSLQVEERKALAEAVTYIGNPEHKRNPGDFGLTPPAQPRRGKSLCDGASIFKRSDALRYVREGFERGAVSEQSIDGWPKIVWAVTEDGTPLEAQRDGNGSYHGYPMPLEDPMAAEVKRFWNS